RGDEREAEGLVERAHGDVEGGGVERRADVGMAAGVETEEGEREGAVLGLRALGDGDEAAEASVAGESVEGRRLRRLERRAAAEFILRAVGDAGRRDDE